MAEDAMAFAIEYINAADGWNGPEPSLMVTNAVDSTLFDWIGQGYYSPASVGFLLREHTTSDVDVIVDTICNAIRQQMAERLTAVLHVDG